MADTRTTNTPIFYETLAGIADTTPAEARELIDTIPGNSPGTAVLGFLDEFAPAYPVKP